MYIFGDKEKNVIFFKQEIINMVFIYKEFDKKLFNTCTELLKKINECSKINRQTYEIIMIPYCDLGKYLVYEYKKFVKEFPNYEFKYDNITIMNNLLGSKLNIYIDEDSNEIDAYDPSCINMKKNKKYAHKVYLKKMENRKKRIDN